MTRRIIHVLSDGMRTPNSVGLVYPLLVHDAALRDRGLSVRIFERPERDYADCDLLIVDSKHFAGPERGQLSFVQDALQNFAAKAPLAWYDSTDSAGWLVGGVMPLVRRYYKNQLLRDRSAYTRPMYGRRAYTDYYHRTAGVADAQPEEAPALSDAGLLDRIRLGWNSGLADYTRWGPLRTELYRRFRAPPLQTRRLAMTPASKPRSIQLSFRMGTSYDRATVSYQRRQLAARFGRRFSTDKLGRGAYLAEMRNSRLVVSPFGLGEITLKDFEVFLTGGLLLKPDMSHLETWPDLYRPDETVAAFAWDLSDFENVVDRYLADPRRAIAIAEAGQNLYLRHVVGDEAPLLFANLFAAMADDAIVAPKNDLLAAAPSPSALKREPLP